MTDKYRAEVDPASLVHPDFQGFIELLKLSTAAPAPTVEALPAMRGNTSPLLQPPLDTPPWREQIIPGAKGAPDVSLYIVNAGRKDAPRPAILHTHGGGYITMTAKSMLRVLQDVAVALDCVIVSVEYRLAPETPFPGALEDNYAGLKWLHAHAEELGADPTRIALMGESAGGGHAAMLAIAARDRGEVPVIYQALTYPMLDDRTGSTRDVPSHIGTYVWRPVDNRFGWSSLLGKPAGSDDVPYGSVPARVEDLSGLPPAFIGTGALDLFVDEDIEYARRLNDAGVPVELHVYPGCFHAFDMLPVEIAGQYRAALINGLKGAFRR